MKLSTTIILSFACFAALQLQCQSAPTKSLPHATIRGNVVRLVPSGFTFSIPEAWVRFNQPGRKTLHLSRSEIEQVEKGEGEWDLPFGAIVNSIFPYQQCAAHAGGEGWGRESASFADVQMRAYVGAWSVDQVEAMVRKHGFAAASKFSQKISLAESRVGQWQVSHLSYWMFYFDYGATARIDVYAQAFGKQTAALVFMYTDASDKKQIAQVVNSFKANG